MYFLFGPRPVQRALGNYLGCQDFLRFQVSHFVALCETAPAERFASGVFLYDNLSISLGHFLLNDDCIPNVLLLHVWLRFHLYFKYNIIDHFYSVLLFNNCKLAFYKNIYLLIYLFLSTHLNQLNNWLHIFIFFFYQILFITMLFSFLTLIFFYLLYF